LHEQTLTWFDLSAGPVRSDSPQALEEWLAALRSDVAGYLGEGKVVIIRQYAAA
jgi:hypothetical protein